MEVINRGIWQEVKKKRFLKLKIDPIMADIKVWPIMKKFKLSKIPDEIDEVPLVLASHSDGLHDYIALEDLSYKGYKTSGRNDKVNERKISIFLELLANFHALSIACREQNPEFEKIAKKLVETYFQDKFRGWYTNFMYQTMGPKYQTAVKNELPEMYYEKVSKLFSEDFYGSLCKCCKIYNKFSVVTQGDAWLPNFLVSTDQSGNHSAVLIDFQLARYSTLVNDLIHFLYSCVPEELLVNEWDKLIAEYHTFLSIRLEKLGTDRNFITLNELNEEIQRYGIFGVGMSMESVLMSLLRDDEVADLDFLQGEKEVPLESVWVIPEYDQERNRRLAFLVKHAVDKGFIG